MNEDGAPQDSAELQRSKLREAVVELSRLEARHRAEYAASRERWLDEIGLLMPKTLERVEAWDRVWMLSLGAGNAAGLLALGSAAINVLAKPGAPDYWSVLLPPLWFFAVGMVIAALMPWVRLMQQIKLHNYQRAVLQDIAAESLQRPLPRGIGRYGLLEGWLGRIAATLFATGIFWPIVAVTFFR